MSEMKSDQYGRFIPSSNKRFFSNSSNPVVRIGNRMFIYNGEGYIRGTYPDLESFGFKKKGTYFERPVNAAEIESAYKVSECIAVYKGILVYFQSFKEESNSILIWSTDKRVGDASGISPYYDYGDRLMYCVPQYYGEVPEKDVTDIYETRKPYKGFKFVGPEKVYRKKNGVWIQCHFTGTPLKDGELF